MITLTHRDLGGAGRPPLLVLHGLLGSSRNWQTAGGDLAVGFHVRALDLRNHGRSPHAEEMSYEAMVADVLRWMDAEGLTRVSLMGHSMGGKVAMLLACRYPERVERLVVVDIAPKSYHSAGHRSEFAAMNELDLRTLQSRAEAELKFEARVGDWAMRKFLTTNLEKDADQKWRWIVNLPVLTQALPRLEDNPLETGERYAGPTLFVAGGKSRYIEPKDHETIAHHFPSSRCQTIPAAGHNPHMETRVEFSTLVATWLTP